MGGDTEVMAAALAVSKVSHEYGPRVALDSVSFELRSGATALLGVNGAGKSTLLRALSGARRPTSGSVWVGDADLYQRSTRRTALARVALMPQSAIYPSSMTALEVVALAAWLRGVRSSACRRRAAAALERVGLAERSGSRMGQLSGGMARRVALAQAIVADPEVLLLDEPSTGLDPQQRRVMIDLLRSFGTTALFSSHVVEDVVEVADRVLVLDDGRLVFEGGVDELAESAAVATGDVADRVERAFLRLVSRRERLRA